MRKKTMRAAAVLLACVLLGGCGNEAVPANGGSVTDAPLASPLELPGDDTLAPADATVAFLANYMTQPAPDYTLFRAEAEAKGIYVSANIAGTEYVAKRFALVRETELNAMVIDVKHDNGFITFKNKVPTADALGIVYNLIPNFDALMAQLKEEGIYTIARFVVFKDSTIVEQRPDFAIRDTSGANGGVYKERKAGGYGSAWLNPYNREVWEYIVDLAVEVAALGFDEIQFDYVRFPTDATTKYEDFGDTGGMSKVEILTAFSQYAYERISPTGVKLSADIFGTVINSQLDASLIGQDFVELSKIYDVVCPMIYASHYAQGSFGIADPDLQPYDVVYKSMKLAVEKLAEIPAGQHVAVVRPWLQAFTASYLSTPYQQYEGPQVREQIQACYDAGLTEWLLWNQDNLYPADGLLPAEDFTPAEAAE